MVVPIISLSPQRLARLCLYISNHIHYQCTPEELVEHTLRLGQGHLTSSGALAVNTGTFTGRVPNDKFTVKDEVTENTVNWNEVNIPIDEMYFHIVHSKIM